MSEIKNTAEMRAVLIKYLQRELGGKAKAKEAMAKMTDQRLEWEYLARVMKPL